ISHSVAVPIHWTTRKRKGKLRPVIHCYPGPMQERCRKMRIQRPWALALPILATLTFSGAHTPQSVANQDADVLAGQTIVGSFTNALEVARNDYAGQIDPERVTKSSILGMLHTLDPHSSYLDPKEWQDFQSQQHSHYSGIGSTIIPHNGKVYILSPFD